MQNPLCPMTARSRPRSPLPDAMDHLKRLPEWPKGEGKCMADAVRVERIIVRTGRLICDVRIEDAAVRMVVPALAQAAREAFPTLPYHSCVNEVGPTFSAVMDGTSVPHLIEHIAIDIQTRAADDPEATFVGTTEWLSEAGGRARIELSFVDDLQAMRAFNQAVSFVNEFCPSE